MKLANENKTLKQLLNSQYCVQKKEGYYSYEVFNDYLIYLINKEKKLGCPYYDFHYVEAFNGLKADYENEKEKRSRNGAGYFASLYNLFSFAATKEKRISYLNNSLFDLFTKTKPPSRFVIDRVFVNKCLILLPRPNTFTFLYLHVIDNKISFTGKITKEDKILITYFTMGKSLDKSQYYCEEECKESNLLCLLASNFLLWQQSMHDKGEEVIELDAPTKTMGFGKNSKQIIVPRVIGEGYKPKVIRNYEPQGTHASPRTHWRSGHWRQHMIGSRKEPQHKTIWVEPVLVNG